MYRSIINLVVTPEDCRRPDQIVYVVRATWAYFGLHADSVTFNTQIEE
jgi:hypothetical protein